MELCRKVYRKKEAAAEQNKLILEEDIILFCIARSERVSQPKPAALCWLVSKRRAISRGFQRGRSPLRLVFSKEGGHTVPPFLASVAFPMMFLWAVKPQRGLTVLLAE